MFQGGLWALAEGKANIGIAIASRSTNEIGIVFVFLFKIFITSLLIVGTNVYVSGIYNLSVEKKTGKKFG
jgi:hypothetical protein